MSQYATNIARVLGYSPEAMDRLRTAALLHDIGGLGLAVSDRKFAEGDEVSPETLRAKRLVRRKNTKIKVLANGEVSFPVTLTVHAISQKAKEIVEKSGGRVNLIS